ncbi:hypothetical protein [Acinetobacter defluvii]|uniref:hypothetical protein n=1 Tax=Acinetobacter defluvii TaxID=1871111 RepID=UPI00082634E2|nr:hypothetical protein [Acinetobacter defluvii]
MSSLQVGQRVYVDYVSSSATEFSDKHVTGSAVIDRVEDGYVFGRLLSTDNPFMCNVGDVRVLPFDAVELEETWKAEFYQWWDKEGQYLRAGGSEYYQSFAWASFKHVKQQMYAHVQDYHEKVKSIHNHFVWSSDDAADKQKKATTDASINYYEGKRYVYDVEQFRLQQILDSKPQV